MLIILQELMHRTFVELEGRAPKRHEIPKPCDHFDLIVGTGTGGLIALMLGRLRLSIETCKDVYVRMTKRVFETDKTIAGIPYRSTLFKASKLEEAIRECVREHTVYETEGNDRDEGLSDPESPSVASMPMVPGSAINRPSRSMSVASRYSQIGMAPISDFRGGFNSPRFGNPNALLYDAREKRTKTYVTPIQISRHRHLQPPVPLLPYIEAHAEDSLPSCSDRMIQGKRLHQKRNAPSGRQDGPPVLLALPSSQSRLASPCS
jgi:hypothetical protein